jgi:predicted Rossmann fold nucleotide-binding protein DprA/Smf involved in DNA uptake
MNSLALCHSANDAPRVMRSGGRGFYSDRGRPYPNQKRRSEERDRKRTQEEREAAAVGRALADLANQFPRFKASLNQVRFQVLVQVRKPEWKCREILKHLGDVPISPEEISEETGLDRKSVDDTLLMLEGKGRAEQCTRNGGKVVMRSHGRPVEKIYWRLAN